MCNIVYACISKHLIIFIGKEISRFQCCETWWPNMVASSMKSRYPLTACCIPCVFDIFVAYIYIYVQSSTAFFKKDMQTSFVHFPMENRLTSGISFFFFFLGGYKQLQQFKHQSLSRPRLPFRSALRSETIVRFTLPQSNAILRVGTGSWERRNMYT